MILKYEFKNGTHGELSTPCPHGRYGHGEPVMVGSLVCWQDCPFFASRDRYRQTIRCDHRPPLKSPEFLGKNFCFVDHAIVRTLVHYECEGIGGTSDIDLIRGSGFTTSIFNLKSWGDRGWQVAL